MFSFINASRVGIRQELATARKQTTSVQSVLLLPPPAAL
jgi:hypothetical protein